MFGVMLVIWKAKFKMKIFFLKTFNYKFYMAEESNITVFYLQF